MTQPSPPFDAESFFSAELAQKYDEAIRLSCPAYDALHGMIPPLLRGLPADAAFLSAGAGTGAEIITLGRRYPGWRFVGVDVSADMLQTCRRRIAEAGIGNAVDLHHGTVEQYRAPARFDAASSVFIVNYIKGHEQKLAYLRSIAASLKPGGAFVLADLYGDRASPDFVRLMHAWTMMYVSKGVRGENLADLVGRIFNHIAFVPEDEVLQLLREAGFVDTVRFFQAFLYGAWVATRGQAPITSI